MVGRDVEAAEAAVRAAGFTAVRRAYRGDASARGTVLVVDPTAGTSAARAGATVTLTVSAGPTTVTVPAVVGRRGADAEATLRAAGLTVRRQADTGVTLAAAGTVEGVSPPTGSRVAAGSSVTIIVVADPVMVPDLRGRPVGDAESTLSGLGLTVARRLRSGAGAAPGTVLDQLPPSGGADRGDTVTLVVAQDVAGPSAGTVTAN
ncbi:PASTA domain-containing protein [Frankia sp. AgB32]|nr:PASTA domain-containing protein [Frankia sp. AgB32]